MGTATKAITLRTVGKVVVAEFTRGELKDEREILRLLERIGELVEKREGSNLLLNMEHVTYISSSGLGALVSLMKKAARTGGVLKICCLQDDVREVFKVMRLDRIFEIFPSEDEAILSY
jgi:anti-sigma B factor antagonist